MMRIFSFDESYLNSSSSDISSRASSQSTTTINDYRNQSSGTQASESESAGIFEDHPGLNPNDERIIELQCEIREKLQELMINRSEDAVLAAAEGLHAESDNVPFMQSILDDLNRNGVQGEAYREALDLAQLVPSPLDQFSILPLIPMKMGNLSFSFTNPSLFMLLTLSLFLLLLSFVTKKGGGKSVPNAWQSLVELLYDFVLNPVNEQIGGLSGKVKQKFFPCILVTFTFLLFCNLQGMIPYSFTVTSHFLITLGLSFSLFIGITIVGFQKNGLHFLSFLLPAGVPLPLAPFLVLLELISYCFRALSLGIRLFANMMAGHSLVKILSGFAWTMLCMNDLFYFIGDLGPLFIVLALTGLELGVAILQAHVFTILICIYLNDAINLH
uniref:ATP synthase subunit a n=1 Tax=Passiflora edulis TaxID=78168 RepID=A0A7L7SIE7_PASED|nr:ATP synthase F0 subunit 6 [Passiflora edulis]QNZ92481.1 ATP synthase F0 subunit 6 [Passiflora edulis]